MATPPAPGNPATAAQPASLPALTSLRFFAAFAVLLLHYRDLVGPLPPLVFKAIVGGQYGVTFFFVLSGFILTYNYQAWFAGGVGAPSYWRFQRLRLARIYPIYLVGLLLDTPWHLFERWQAGQLAESGHVFWASWLLNLVGLQAWIPGVPYAMFWNTPAWSVSAEFFFYAAFPFVCARLAGAFRRPGAVLWAIGAVVVAQTVLYAAVVWVLNYASQVGAQTQYLITVYNPLLRFGEFLAGCLAGGWFLMVRAAASRGDGAGVGLLASERVRNLVIAVALAAVTARVLSPDYTGPSAAAWVFDVAIKYPFYIVPFTAIILAVASGRTFLSGLLERPWLVLLGEASYSLYIIHWAGQSFLKMGFLGAAGTPFVHMLFLAGTVAASVWFYRVVELPWRARLRGEPSRRPMLSSQPT
ncbi:MAG TPA: acyltransferase [Ramlibacter sp.]|nr:acyltransferase [Ramlibacter sp.]